MSLKQASEDPWAKPLWNGRVYLFRSVFCVPRCRRNLIQAIFFASGVPKQILKQHLKMFPLLSFPAIHIHHHSCFKPSFNKHIENEKHTPSFRIGFYLPHSPFHAIISTNIGNINNFPWQMWVPHPMNSHSSNSQNCFLLGGSDCAAINISQ